MKIAINASTLVGSENTGIRSYTRNLLESLADIDDKNDYFLLYTSLRKKNYEMPGPSKKNFSKIVLPIVNFKFPFRNILINSLVLPLFLKNHNCEIYHALAGSNLPKSRKVKKIITVHDLRTLIISDDFYPQDIKSLGSALKTADLCIAVSETTKKAILNNFRIAPDKVKVVYLGVDDKFKQFQDKSSVNSIRYKYGLSKKYFFSVGAVPRKNVTRLIKAYSLFKYRNDFLLVIGGAGSNGSWSIEHKELISDLGLDKVVKMIGYIPNEDLPLLYSASECFVFPSLYEGFGLPILEAMKSGIPVITSNASSLPEVGGDAAFYVDPYDEKSIAKAMEKVIEDNNLKQTLIEKGTERVKKFSWNKMAKEILNIYEKLA